MEIFAHEMQFYKDSIDQSNIHFIEQSISHSIHMLQDAGIPKETAILQLMNHFQLSTEEAVSKIESYWK